jgi:glycerophosphoryl diester phosphodiesterase
VHASADGVVVVVHDPTLDRTTDATGAVKAFPLAALRDVDAGARFRAPDGTFPYRGRGVRIPTLAEVLDAFPGVPLNIEIKQDDPPIEANVLATLDRFDGRERVLLAAEEAAIMARIRAAAPDVLTSFSSAEVAAFVLGPPEGTLPRAFALQIPPVYGDRRLITAESVAAAHALGMEVHAWTINDEDEMDALLELGVDGLMTDWPARASAVLRRRGLR